MNENNQMLQTVNMTCGNFNVTNQIIFHAVYIPEENVTTENNVKGKHSMHSYVVCAFDNFLSFFHYALLCCRKCSSLYGQSRSVENN